MSQDFPDLDSLLAGWPYVPGQVLVRQLQGADGRELLQIRVDMGLLQLECSGRPDGIKPEGCKTYYDYLCRLAAEEGESFRMDERRCHEIDREFYQFYHRRICWLTLKRYREAMLDAQHTLALMDFSSEHSPDPEWSLLHERHRPFVVFHKTQAAALFELEEQRPTQSLECIDQGLEELSQVFKQHDALEFFDEDAFVSKLREMRASIAEHYELGPTLAEQLAAEEYELAAELRDQMNLSSGER